jgi:hypothetical protein
MTANCEDTVSYEYTAEHKNLSNIMSLFQLISSDLNPHKHKIISPYFNLFHSLHHACEARIVVQFVGALRRTPGGCGFYSQFLLKFFIDIILSATLRPWGRLRL